MGFLVTLCRFFTLCIFSCIRVDIVRYLFVKVEDVSRLELQTCHGARNISSRWTWIQESASMFQAVIYAAKTGNLTAKSRFYVAI